MRQARWFKTYAGLAREARLSIPARLTLIVLRSYCASNRDFCWPSTETLCADLGCDRKALFRYLHELESKHWIKRRHRRRQNNAFSSTKYELLDERKSLLKTAFPCSQIGDTATIRELPPDKYTVAKKLRRKIIQMPCSQIGDAIKSDLDTG